MREENPNAERLALLFVVKLSTLVAAQASDSVSRQYDRGGLVNIISAFFWSNETAYDIWRLVKFSLAAHGKCAPKPLLGSDDKGWEGSLC
jgi:hypothetical protein